MSRRQRRITRKRSQRRRKTIRKQRGGGVIDCSTITPKWFTVKKGPGVRYAGLPEVIALVEKHIADLKKGENAAFLAEYRAIEPTLWSSEVKDTGGRKLESFRGAPDMRDQYAVRTISDYVRPLNEALFNACQTVNREKEAAAAAAPAYGSALPPGFSGSNGSGLPTATTVPYLYGPGIPPRTNLSPYKVFDPGYYEGKILLKPPPRGRTGGEIAKMHPMARAAYMEAREFYNQWNTEKANYDRKLAEEKDTRAKNLLRLYTPEESEPSLLKFPTKSESLIADLATVFPAAPPASGGAGTS